MGDYPNDADGDALRGVVESGSDMDKPMYIDFQVAVPSEAAGISLAGVASSLGYRTEVYASPKCRLGWTCQCSTRMLATYAGVIAIQKELAEISRELGGIPDGWGTFGNKPGGQWPVK